MNLRDLNYLVAVADLKHFGKAAAQCYVSQPTLSAQLKKLEAELGVQLFERNNKQVLITSAGEIIIKQARIVLREADALKTLAQLANDPLAGSLRLGVIPTLGPYLLPYVIPSITKQLPKLKLYFYEEKTDDLLKSLHQGNLDAIILALPVNTQHCEINPLFEEQFFVALPKHHKLSKKPSIQMQDLSKEHILLLEDGHCLREQALAICEEQGLEEKPEFKASSLETLRQMVAAGNGITFLPKLAISNGYSNHASTTIRPLSPSAPTRKIAMLRRKNSAHKDCHEKIAAIIRHEYLSLKD